MKNPQTKLRIVGAMLLAIGYGHAHASPMEPTTSDPRAHDHEALIVTVPEKKPESTGHGFEYTVNKYAPDGTDAEVLYEAIWNDVLSSCSMDGGFIQHYTHDRTHAPSGSIHPSATDGAFALCSPMPPVAAEAHAPVRIVIARRLTTGPFSHRIAARGDLVDAYKLVHKKAYDRCLRDGQRVHTAWFSYWSVASGFHEVNVDFTCDNGAPLHRANPEDDTARG